MQPLESVQTSDILKAIAELENNLQIKSLIAIESGSRAWGFPSRDSDYDVRMIYHHPKNWYLCVFEEEDNFTVPITGLLDIGGWDIRKSLRLLYKGNAVVHEWLNSPMVYQKNEQIKMLKDFALEVFNPAPAFYHYLSMAKKKLELGQDDPSKDHHHSSSRLKSSFTAKQLLYGWRTLLCAKWVHQKKTPPPMAFQDLLQEFFTDYEPVSLKLKKIISIKHSESEKDTLSVDNHLSEYAMHLFSEISQSKVPNIKQSTEVFNQFFGKFLEALYS